MCFSRLNVSYSTCPLECFSRLNQFYLLLGSPRILGMFLKVKFVLPAPWNASVGQPPSCRCKGSAGRKTYWYCNILKIYWYCYSLHLCQNPFLTFYTSAQGMYEEKEGIFTWGQTTLNIFSRELCESQYYEQHNKSIAILYYYYTVQFLIEVVNGVNQT